MVTEMYSGPCVALEILQTNPAKTFRELCGPADPVSYRYIAPRPFQSLTKYLHWFHSFSLLFKRNNTNGDTLDKTFYSK